MGGARLSPGGGTPGTPRVLRAMNDRAALDLLLAHGPLSRARIGRLTGLSKPTTSQLLARLEAADLVLATGRSEGHPGPNAQLYEVNPAVAHVGGVDVRPGRLLAGVADLTGRTLATHEVPTAGGAQRAGLPEELLIRALDGATEAAGLTRDALHRVVIGTPGAFDPTTGRLRYASHLPGWHDPALLERIAALLPMPIEYENDVNLVAIAEERLGSAVGQEDFALLWIEQGIGAALVLGGRLHRGRTGGAGELGFLPVPGAPLVRHPARANAGGYQQLAGPGAVLQAAARLGIRHENDDSDGDSELHDHAGHRTDQHADPPAPANSPDTHAQWRHGELGAPPPHDDRTHDDRTHHAAPHTPTHARQPADLAAALLATGSAQVRAGVESQHTALLREFATATAVGLASLVAVVDPALLVLSGGVLSAGGEPLRALIEAELAELAVPRPTLALGSVSGPPVLGGALQSALATTRDEVFDTSG